MNPPGGRFHLQRLPADSSFIILDRAGVSCNVVYTHPRRGANCRICVAEVANHFMASVGLGREAFWGSSLFRVAFCVRNAFAFREA
ncbi:hypothetical protein J6590_038035 [Homalodisca vitripennis]|nr:hypothetical protein J6590_038035 [Homalodisca vitripennis]